MLLFGALSNKSSILWNTLYEVCAVYWGISVLLWNNPSAIIILIEILLNTPLSYRLLSSEFICSLY